MYVAELIVPHTVNTMPRATLDAFADHGVVTTTPITATHAGASRVVEELRTVGVDIDDVTHTLEREGLEKIEKSWASGNGEVVSAQSDRLAGTPAWRLARPSRLLSATRPDFRTQHGRTAARMGS